MTTAIEQPSDSADQQQALNELDEAAKLAKETLALDPSLPSHADQSDLTQSVNEPQDEAALQEARRERMRDRAKRQRQRGREEMQREYTGVMVVDRDLEVFDPAIASSVTRFMALTDRTVHLLTRRGDRFLSSAQVDKILDAIQSKIDTYVKEGEQAKNAAQELINKHSPAEFLWLVPRYTTSILKHSFQIKTRSVIFLSDGAHDWDEAIRMMCELEFNAKVKADQIAAVRRRERVLFSNLNYFCIQTILGMYRNSMPKELQESQPTEEGIVMSSAE